MPTRQVTIIKANYRDQKKDGTPFINKNGKPFWICGINFRDDKGGEHWANAYVDLLERRDYIKGLEAGTTVIAQFETDDYGLKFDAKKLEVVSRPGVETSQALEATAAAIGGTPVATNVEETTSEIKVDEIPF